MLRVSFGVFGGICLLLSILLNQIRIDEPIQLMIVTGGGDNVFLYNEVSGNFISVTEEWDSQYFTGSKSSGIKRDFIPVPDGTLIVGYDTTTSQMSDTFFRFDPISSEVNTLLSGKSFAKSHGLSPDRRWLIFSLQGQLYRQRVGSEVIEPVTEHGPFTFRGWVSDGRKIVVTDWEFPQGLYLIDFYSGKIELAATEGSVHSVWEINAPEWFLVSESTDSQIVSYAVNFSTGNRIKLMPINNSALYSVVGFDNQSQSLIYWDIDSLGTRELRRLHSDGFVETLFSHVSDVKWIFEDRILVAVSLPNSTTEVWTVSTKTWQPQRVDMVFSRYLNFGWCVDDGCFVLDGDDVKFIGFDGSFSDTLSKLPAYVSEVRGQSPYDGWFIVEGQEDPGSPYLSRLRPDGKKVKAFFPKHFAFRGFHGWLPLNYYWHFLPLIGLGGVLLIVSGQGLRRR